MMQILYVPLDERPCNYDYPQMETAVRHDISLLIPPREILGRKKQPADMNGVWDFIFDHISECNSAVLSAEMLFYGGLLPSRLHHLPQEWKRECIDRIRSLKRKNPSIKLYLFQLIMRTPRYSSSDEEPDYYEEFGEEIFFRAYYEDKKKRTRLSDTEETRLHDLNCLIPINFLEDYEWRRKYNLDFNQLVLELVSEGVIDFLAIPQDDSCEFGYTARDQGVIKKEIRKRRIQQKVLMYPGADEAGCTLTARAVTDLRKNKIKVYPFYASQAGPSIIPLYEDRCMLESLKSHIMAVGGIMVSSSEEAELILAINSPGKEMCESFEQGQADFTYISSRNLNWFVQEIVQYVNQGKAVAVADCAYANGGDVEFLELLDSYQVLDRLVSYKGWNTHCNTLGSTLAQGVLAFGGQVRNEKLVQNLIYHILDDGFYQPMIRKAVTDGFADTGLTYFDLKKSASEIGEKETLECIRLWSETIKETFQDVVCMDIRVHHPWNRMFEIGLELDIKFKE